MRLLVILALVAYTVASECGPLQRIRVKVQWAEAYGQGAASRNAMAVSIFETMFNIDSNLRTLFSGVNVDDLSSNEFRAHCSRVTNGVDRLISSLDDEATFTADLAHLKTQHVSRNIPANGYTVMGAALKSIIPGRSSCYDASAWEACFNAIAAGISS